MALDWETVMNKYVFNELFDLHNYVVSYDGKRYETRRDSVFQKLKTAKVVAWPEVRGSGHGPEW